MSRTPDADDHAHHGNAGNTKYHRIAANTFSRRIGRACAPVLLSLVAAAQAAELARVDPAQVEHAASSGLEVVAHYPDFTLVRADRARLDAAARSGLQLQIEPHGYRLALPYAAAVDPLEAGLQSSTALSDGLALVQFIGPIQPGWIEDLQDAGISVVQYLHPYTYIVSQQDQALPRLAAQHPDIRWIGPWPQSAKLSPQVDTRSSTLLQVQVLASRAQPAQRSALQELDATVLGTTNLDASLQIQQLRLRADRLPALAALPEVLSVQLAPEGAVRGELSNQQLAGNADASGQPLPGYLDWLNGFGLNGNGVRIAHVDDSVAVNHPDLASRIWPCTGSTCATGDATVHGTHTAGIAVGTGSMNSAGVFKRGLGVAPGAQLVPQNWNPHFLASGGMLLLMKQSVNNGAVLSNNSWGSSSTARGYDADTRQVDLGIRDADSDAAGDQPLIFVLSIMNGSGGTSSQGAPDEAKNSITVGATRSQLNASTGLAEWLDLAGLSGHGPALDGRRIPHLVAPGCSVDSTAPSPTFHLLQCGTSMATPHVSGSLALFIQAFRNRHGRTPSTALAKAALLTATRDLAGHKDANGATMGHRPDHRQGWGQLQLDRLLQQLPLSYNFDQQHVFTATGQSWSVPMRIRSAGQAVQVFLTWTDAPGHGLCAGPGCTTPAWNNDLNLEVTVTASTYKGNVFDAQGNATSGGVADEKNNAEAVLFESGRVSGDFTVTVRAANINSDALPNSTGSLQQDFALYCVNCEEIPIFRDGLE